MSDASSASRPMSPRLATLLVAGPWMLGLPLALVFNPWVLALVKGAPLNPYTEGRTLVFFLIFLVMGVSATLKALWYARTWIGRTLAAHPRFVRGLLAFGLIVQTALALDAVVGVKTAGMQFMPELFRTDSARRFVQRPHLDQLIAGKPSSTDAQGYRTQPAELLANAAARRVAFAGDSIVFGWALADGEDLPTVLSRRLAPEVVVLNRGIIGYDIQEYGFLIEDVLSEQPDEIWIGLCLNDISWGVASRLDGPASDPSTRPARATKLNRLKWFVQYHSGLLNLGKLRSPFFVLRTEDELNAYVEQSARDLLDDPAHREQRIQMTARFLQGFDEAARAAGIPLRVVVFPYRFQLLEDDPATDAIQRDLAAALASTGIAMHDLLPLLRERVRADAIDPRELFADVNHFSPRGVEVLADLLAPLLEEPAP